MKKYILAILTALMLLALAACGGTETEPTKTGSETEPNASESTVDETKTAAGTFRVGYAKENITPDDPVPLSGYGNSDKRMSDGYLDYIYTTCVAMTDENENTILFFTTDIVISNETITQEVRKTLSGELGIPEDQILMTATHTHSSVDVGYAHMKVVADFIENFKQMAVKAGHEAMDDRTEVTSMKVGTADLTGYNYVRHYFTDLDESVGDNHGEPWQGTLNRHASTANPIMYLLSFERTDGKKPVLLANWRAHDHITGGGARLDLSADFTGMFRTYLEKDENLLFAYYQGECGNINPNTRLKEDGVDGVTIEISQKRNYKVYARECCDIIEKALKENMKEAKIGPISVTKVPFVGKVNHTQDSLLAVAQEIQAYWTETNDRTGAVNMGIEYGIASPYHANAIVSRASSAYDKEFFVYYGNIGEIGFVETPFELFDTNGVWLRENSPFETTLIIGYSNTHNGYLPSQYGFEYGCYEADISTFEPGTSEKLMQKLSECLKDLKKN